MVVMVDGPTQRQKNVKKHKESTKRVMGEKRSKWIEENGLQMSYKGKFFPINIKKYVGNPSNIVYRSLWERKFMVWCDTNDSIIDWQSEEFCIPYRDPAREMVIRRYFPDFLITTKQANGTIKKKLVEVKPFSQTQEPEKKTKVTKKFITEVMTYTTNQAKWNAAKAYCEDRGWEFVIITEKELFPKTPK